MWRAPLLFFFLMVAFALVAPPRPSVNNEPVNQGRAGEIAKRHKVPTTFVTNAPEPALYKRPCQNTSDDRQSDLCAQWRTVDWTMWGVLVGLFGTAALIYQIMLTREALEDTGKATAAMERQNEIATEVRDRQLRPYVSFMDTSPRNKPGSSFADDRELKLMVKNFGQTPAEDVRLFHASEVRDKPIGWEQIELEYEPESFGKISPTDSRTATISLDVTDEQASAIADG